MKRINLISKIISKILKISFQESKKLVLKTHVGKGILNNNETYLYEQETANTYDILRELNLITDERKVTKLIVKYYLKYT